jgi:hypothetical protein
VLFLARWLWCVLQTINDSLLCSLGRGWPFYVQRIDALYMSKEHVTVAFGAVFEL